MVQDGKYHFRDFFFPVSLLRKITHIWKIPDSFCGDEGAGEGDVGGELNENILTCGANREASKSPLPLFVCVCALTHTVV